VVIEGGLAWIKRHSFPFLKAIYLREIVEEIFKLKDKSVPIHAIVENKGSFFPSNGVQDLSSLQIQ